MTLDSIIVNKIKAVISKNVQVPIKNVYFQLTMILYLFFLSSLTFCVMNK